MERGPWWFSVSVIEQNQVDDISVSFPVEDGLVHMRWFCPRPQSHCEILKQHLEGKWVNRATKITQPLSFHMHIINVFYLTLVSRLLRGRH